MRGVAVRLVRRMPVALLRRPLAAGAAPLDPVERLPGIVLHCLARPLCLFLTGWRQIRSLRAT